MEFKRIKRKTAGLIAAAALAAAMTTGAYAQNVVDDIIDGAENIVDDTGDAAENILGGNDNDANDRNNADNADNVLVQAFVEDCGDDMIEEVRCSKNDSGDREVSVSFPNSLGIRSF